MKLRRWGALAAIALGVLAVPQTAAALQFSAPSVAIPYPGTATPLSPLPMGEPQLLVADDGRIMVTAQFQMWNCRTGRPLASTGITYQGTGTSKQRLCVWASGDGGQSFHIIGGDCCQNGDDVSLVQTPDGTIIESFMSNIGIGPGVPGVSVSRSTDGGATWNDTIDVNRQVAQDRPFTVVESERNVVMSFTGPPGNIFVIRSHDQGRTWTLPMPVSLVPPDLVLSLNGEPTVDRARDEIVLSYAASQSHFGSIVDEYGTANVLYVARSKDHGRTWTTETAARLPRGRGVLSLQSMSADARGREYMVYDAQVGEHGVGAFLIRSRRDGRWSDPVRVDGGGSSMEPAVRASGNGHVVVAYYHSPSPTARDGVRDWTTDVAVSDDAGRTFARANVSRHTVYRGDEVNASLTLFDLLALGIDREGRANVAWTSDGNRHPNDLKTRIEFARQVVDGP